MKTYFKTTVTILTVAFLSFLFSTRADAAGPIVGTLDFVGVATFDTTSLATATRVNLWNSSFVTKSTLDFSSVSPGTNVTMGTPWVFNSGTPATPMPGPSLAALWNVGGFTFDLSSSTVVSQNSTFLNITGVGTVSGNGFDPTPGTWSFTSSRANGQDSQSFGFQSNTAAVPEGGTIALFATGAILLAGVHLRRKSKTLVDTARSPF
jgi:hypothetical protein